MAEISGGEVIARRIEYFVAVDDLETAISELIAHLREFLSGLYQWKLSLASVGERRPVEGRDLEVRGYQILAGRQLRG